MQTAIRSMQTTFKTSYLSIVCIASVLFLAGCVAVQPRPASPQRPAASTVAATINDTSTTTSTTAARTTGIATGTDSNTTIASTMGPASGTVTIYGGDGDSLREFLRHYLLPVFGPANEGSTAVYIGTLPPELPFSLELSDEIETVGAIVTTGEYDSYQLLFGLAQDVTESVAALRQQLQNQGYSAPDTRAGGEVFRTVTPEYIPLCNAEGTLTVTISGRNSADGTGIIRVFANEVLPLDGACAPLDGGARAIGGLEGALPSLIAPQNISTYSSGMSSDQTSIEATIGFRGNTTIAALAEHYNLQLEEAGWQQLGVAQVEEMAWSGWSLSKDEQSYSATLTIVRIAGSDDRFRATLRVERAN